MEWVWVCPSATPLSSALEDACGPQDHERRFHFQCPTSQMVAWRSRYKTEADRTNRGRKSQQEVPYRSSQDLSRLSPVSLDDDASPPCQLSGLIPQTSSKSRPAGTVELIFYGEQKLMGHRDCSCSVSGCGRTSLRRVVTDISGSK
jgi:hypothetical protein